MSPSPTIPAPTASAGPPAASRADLVAAIDVGGTKIAGGLVGPAGDVLLATSRPTPRTGDPAVVMRAVDAVLDELAATRAWQAVRRVGVGSAGPVDIEHGTVSPVNIPAWRAFPLLDGIRAHPAVRGLPAALAGDAVAMAAGEYLYGAAAGSVNALCVVVSTGVGGGLVLGGRIMPGATGNAGHIGHICVELDGEPCPCGGRGCLEGFASGPAIARYARARGWDPGDGVGCAAAAARAAAAGDVAALAAFDRAARALAAGIAATAALVEIDTVVIGGGVAQAGDLLFEPLRGWLQSYATLSFTRSIEIRPAKLGVYAGLSGAAAYARGAGPARGHTGHSRPDPWQTVLPDIRRREAIVVPGLELVAGYLWAWFSGKAKRVGKLADDEVDRVATALMDRLHEAIMAKLPGDPAVKQLEGEAAEGVESERTRRRVTDAVEQAAEDDEEFGRKLRALLTELADADAGRFAGQHAERTGAVRQSGGGVNVAVTGVVGGDLVTGAPER